MTYLTLLPSDLVLEQSLYLNHSDTEAYCTFFTFCNRIWAHKIMKEFDISPAATMLPLSLKYLELMSLTKVDFGSEYFIDPVTFINRASRYPDKKIREKLLDYIFGLDYIDETRKNQIFLYLQVYILRVLTGLLSINDTKLYNKYVKLYQNSISDRELIILAKAETGISEVDPVGILELKGFARGGHLDLMQPYLESMHVIEILDLAKEAAQFQQRAVISYLTDVIAKYFERIPSYKTIEMYKFLDLLICNNDPHFSIEIIRKLPLKHIYPLINSAAKAGSIFLIQELSKIDTSAIKKAPLALDNAFKYNHVDMMLYLVNANQDVYYIDTEPDVLLNPLIIELELANKLVPVELIDRLVDTLFVREQDRPLIRSLINKYITEQDESIVELHRNLRTQK